MAASVLRSCSIVLVLAAYVSSSSRTARILPPAVYNNAPDLVLSAGYPGWNKPTFRKAPKPAEGRFLYYRKNPKVEKYRSAVHELYMRPYNYVSYEMGGSDSSPAQYRYQYHTPSSSYPLDDQHHTPSSSYPQQIYPQPQPLHSQPQHPHPQYQPQEYQHQSYEPAPAHYSPTPAPYVPTPTPYTPKPASYTPTPPPYAPTPSPSYPSGPYEPSSHYTAQSFLDLPSHHLEGKKPFSTFGSFVDVPGPFKDIGSHLGPPASPPPTLYYTSPAPSQQHPTPSHASPTPPFPNAEADFEHSAVAVVKGEKVEGVVRFQQSGPASPLRITGNLTGLSPGLHGFHIHQLGDTTNGCKSMAGHFNPNKVTHGAPTDIYRHSGDLGNIKAGLDGVAVFDTLDKHLSLNGISSIIGRGVVVHQGEDDLGRGGDSGSKKTGNAGGRVACGVIGLSSQAV